VEHAEVRAAEELLSVALDGDFGPVDRLLRAGDVLEAELTSGVERAT